MRILSTEARRRQHNVQTVDRFRARLMNSICSERDHINLEAIITYSMVCPLVQYSSFSTSGVNGGMASTPALQGVGKRLRDTNSKIIIPGVPRLNPVYRVDIPSSI